MPTETVLAGDRLRAREKAFDAIEIFDLNEILHIAQAEMDDDTARRISFVFGNEALVKVIALCWRQCCGT